jgi:uncharacterized protein YbjQ (UPF0145 family)
MLITTTNDVPGKTCQPLGLAKGNVVRAKHLGRDLMAGFKSMVGGELHQYTELMYEARDVATTRMIDDAKRMGADAVLCVRYESCSVTQGASEVMAYGTAVKFV